MAAFLFSEINIYDRQLYSLTILLPVQQKAGNFSISLQSFSIIRGFLLFLRQSSTMLWSILYKISMICHPLSNCGFKLFSVHIVWQETAATRSSSYPSYNPVISGGYAKHERFVPSGLLVVQHGKLQGGGPTLFVDIDGSF